MYVGMYLSGLGDWKTPDLRERGINITEFRINAFE